MFSLRRPRSRGSSARASIDALRREVEELERRLARHEQGWEPGHFYSPIPSLDRVRERSDAIFGPPPAKVPGVDLRPQAQLELAAELARLAREAPWGEKPAGSLRYGFDNPNFRHGEALFLWGMLSRLRPSRVIEIGSGYSTAAICDTADAVLGGEVDVTVVDPYPEVALELLRGDEVELVPSPVEELDTERFQALAAGDVLFVDSTHVVKVDSDVTHLLFRILPALAPGVVVHFHDVHYPFEYPEEWILAGRAWNEAYMLRAFLQYNRAFEILLFASYLAQLHRDALVAELPLLVNGFGSSLWIVRQPPP